MLKRLHFQSLKKHYEELRSSYYKYLEKYLTNEVAYRATERAMEGGSFVEIELPKLEDEYEEDQFPFYSASNWVELRKKISEIFDSSELDWYLDGNVITVSWND